MKVWSTSRIRRRRSASSISSAASPELRDQRVAIGGGGDRRVPGMGQCQPFLAHIADCPNLRAGHLGKVTNDVGPPIAVTDHADPNRRRVRGHGLTRIRKDVNRAGGHRTAQVGGHWLVACSLGRIPRDRNGRSLPWPSTGNGRLTGCPIGLGLASRNPVNESQTRRGAGRQPAPGFPARASGPAHHG